jgi:hypothetical protein
MTSELQFNQQSPVPIMHWKKFAEVVGIDEDIPRGMCDRGHIPAMKLGKHRFINLTKLTSLCLQEDQ